MKSSIEISDNCQINTPVLRLGFYFAIDAKPGWRASLDVQVRRVVVDHVMEKIVDAKTQVVTPIVPARRTSIGLSIRVATCLDRVAVSPWGTGEGGQRTEGKRGVEPFHVRQPARWALQPPRQRCAQRLAIQRLGQVVVHACFQAPFTVTRHRVRGQRDDRRSLAHRLGGADRRGRLRAASRGVVNRLSMAMRMFPPHGIYRADARPGARPRPSSH